MKINFVPDVFEADRWENNYAFRKDLPPGSASYGVNESGEPVTLFFVCPCGCGQLGGLPLTTELGGYGWSWDGNKEFPTLKPSVLQIGPCKWHGFLTKGEWTSV